MLALPSPSYLHNYKTLDISAEFTRQDAKRLAKVPLSEANSTMIFSSSEFYRFEMDTLPSSSFLHAHQRHKNERKRDVESVETQTSEK